MPNLAAVSMACQLPEGNVRRDLNALGSDIHTGPLSQSNAVELFGDTDLGTEMEDNTELAGAVAAGISVWRRAMWQE